METAQRVLVRVGQQAWNGYRMEPGEYTALADVEEKDDL